MSGAELVLSVIGAVAAVDVAIKCGSKFVATCSAFKNAEREILERVLRINNRWYRTKSQLAFLSRVWSTLDREHQELQNQLLANLVSALTIADSKASSFLAGHSKLGRKEKLKYVFLKKILDKTIADLDLWQNEFDPSWFLILKIGGQNIDKELNVNIQKTHNTITTASGIRDSIRDSPQQTVAVLLPKEDLDGARFDVLPYSSAKLAQRVNSTSWLILDPIRSESLPDFQQMHKTVRDLARRLTRTDPLTFSLLKCRGLVVDKAQLQYTLVFKMPDNMANPRSLRSSLNATDLKHSLSDRFQLARQLARAVCSIHTFGLVHKSIRPENILLFRDNSSTLGSAFLVGFESIRPEEGWTRLRSDLDWEKNLYRHPKRQGVQLQDRYIMQHDIYSLGVCLLEIGLWTSFVQYSGSSPDRTSQGFKFFDNVPDSVNTADSVKQQILLLAGEELRTRMGSKYARVVETCLTCLDEGNEDFGDETEFQDEDGVLVAVRYIETVSCSIP
ncbi:hypothetical protein BU16DRAFT_561777 [Lophium mytilinum]|uniref:Protein kinase domain-containing protein n=1 Tax=Lophium mytilinum TaxID=390894 RepID=A0A6A6QTN4_9PEZI|nr:hypothetical protein BU16DRAFT_561777 [Lophium mytilinum]